MTDVIGGLILLFLVLAIVILPFAIPIAIIRKIKSKNIQNSESQKSILPSHLKDSTLRHPPRTQQQPVRAPSTRKTPPRKYPAARNNPPRQTRKAYKPYIPIEPAESSYPAPLPPVLQPVRSHARVYGVAAGKLATGRKRFTKDAIAKGVQGEYLTAQMLESLLDIPHLYIIHGLDFPGSKVADVDHAVVLGNRVVLIDSKMWQGGTYGWGRDDTSIKHMRDGMRTFYRRTHFNSAVQSYQSILASHQAVVASWILIHPNDGHDVNVIHTTSMNVPRIAPAHLGVEQIRTWLLAGQFQGTNEKLKRTLLSHR